MATSLAQIEKQIDELQRQAEKLRKQEAEGVIERIKEAIRIYGFTATDLGLGRGGAPQAKAAAPAAKRTAGAAKFRDPDSGRTWTGRGRRPQWFIDAVANGKKAEDLALG